MGCHMLASVDMIRVCCMCCMQLVWAIGWDRHGRNRMACFGRDAGHVARMRVGIGRDVYGWVVACCLLSGYGYVACSVRMSIG